MGTACGRRGGLPRSEWETTNLRGQSSKTFQQIALRRCRSSRTSSRTSVGILSRCQSRSRTRADSASLAKAEAKAALIAYAAAPRSWAATWATATACPAARAANFAGSGSPCAAAFATNAAWCASRMRTSPRIQERPMSIASRGRVSRGCSCSRRCRTCSAQLRKQPVVLVCQCSAAAHGDQSVANASWQDRHEFVLSRQPRAIAASSP
jgi:hypothetical protein